MIGIYKITNTINHKVYIGQAGKGLNTISGRIKNHLSSLKSNNHCNKHLQSSWNKYTEIYGIECFTFEVIEECSKDELDIMETYWICYYQSYDRRYGYNKDFGGSSGIPTEETRKKISYSRKGFKMSDGQKKKISKANTGENHPNYGKYLSEQTRFKISEANKISQKGRIYSEQTKMKMSESHKGISTWNKGLTKDDNKILEEIGKKISKALKGKPTWNKGLSKDNNEIIFNTGKKISEANKGHYVSEETKQKIRDAQKGEKSHRYGVPPTNKINFTDEQIQDILIRIIKKENRSEIAKDYKCSESTLKNIKWRYKDLFEELKDSLVWDEIR